MVYCSCWLTNLAQLNHELAHCAMHEGRGNRWLDDTDWSVGVVTECSTATAAAAAAAAADAMVMMLVCRITSHLS